MTADNYLFFFAVFAASGSFLWLLGAACFHRRLEADSIYHGPWLGYALLVGVLQITHLFFPINRDSSIVVVLVTTVVALLALLITNAPQNWTKQRAVTALGSTALLLGISFLAFIPVLNGCTKSMCHIDLGVYYLKLIRWTETFPIIPGLVNVQEQLAFNQNAFLITAVFDSLIPNRWGIFLIAGFLPWIGLSLSVFAIVQLLLRRVRHQAKAPAIEIAYAISLPAWLSTLATFSISSASPDCIISCLGIHFFLVFACYVVSEEEDQRTRYFGEVLLLGVLCLTVKSISLGLVIGILAVSFILLVVKKKRRVARVFLEKRVTAMSLVAVAIFATWTGRGIILSGYPLFPSTALAMPVPWRMPTKAIREFQKEIVRWARDPDANSDPKKVLKTWQWLPGWCKRVSAKRTHFAWPAQIGMAGSAALLAASFCLPVLHRQRRSLFLLIVPLISYLVFWFVIAPDPRYFGSTIWLFAICPALTFATGDLRRGLASLLACIGAAAIPIFLTVWEYRWAWSYAEDRLPRYPVVVTRPVTNGNGVAVWMNPDGILTYDAPLPNSWKDRPYLAFLDPKKGIAGGFKFLKPSTLASER